MALSLPGNIIITNDHLKMQTNAYENCTHLDGATKDLFNIDISMKILTLFMCTVMFLFFRIDVLFETVHTILL